MDEYRPSHINAKNTITFMVIRIKEIYDSHHKLMFFKEDDLINLRLHREYQVFIIKSRKIG